MILRLCAATLLLTWVGIATAAAQSLDEAFAAADPAKGAKAFNKCKACHTVDEGGPHRVGPNLWAIINKPVASADGYNYSDAMVAYGGVWSLDRLNAYLTKPREVVPKTRMAFAGLPKAQERADLIAYLNEQSPEPVPLVPAGSETPGPGAEVEQPEEEDYGLLVVAPGVAETHAYCTPCHSEMIVAQQGKPRDGWAKLFEWMIKEQGMAPIEEPDRSIILDYLETHYNTDRPNFPRR